MFVSLTFKAYRADSAGSDLLLFVAFITMFDCFSGANIMIFGVLTKFSMKNNVVRAGWSLLWEYFDIY